MSGGSAPNTAFGIVLLKPWGERSAVDQVIGRLQPAMAGIPSAMIMAINPPAISGLGTASGMDLRLQALQGQSPQELAEIGRSIIQTANQNPQLSRVFTTFSASVPGNCLKCGSRPCRNDAGARWPDFLDITDLFGRRKCQRFHQE